MADITTRAGKGSPLTNDEVDANFTNLNTDKAESGVNSDITSLTGLSGGVGDADYVDFDLAATVARETGRLTWNNVDGCLEVGVIGSNVTQQLGQELLTRVYNAELNPITNGSVVYFHSTSEQLVAVKEFIADGSFDSHLVIGVTTEDIPAGGYGYVCEFGLVRGLNTSAFNPGDIIYASPFIAGDIVNSQPAPPNQILHLGICVESDSTDGIIWISQHDVPASAEITYNNADSSLLATNVKSALDELDLTKADLDLLTSNVTFYATNANDPIIATYKQAVTSTVDPSFDETAVDYSISGISSTATLSQAWITDPNVLTGAVSGIVVPLVGNFRKVSGSGDARFYFEVHARDDLGVETLISTSNTSDYITSTSYTQISLSATITLQEFTATDRVVIKLYSQTDSSTANYEIQLGGSSPFRTLFPVPVSVIPSVALASNITTDTAAFNNILSSTESSVQAALDVLDDHGHQLSDITGVTASNISTTTTGFNGVLSVADDDVQKALNTLDDITLQSVADNGNTVTGNITVGSLSADNLRLDGNTISSTDLNGNISITPSGAGSVIIDAIDICGGFVDCTPIGSSVPDTGDFTTLSATSASFTTVTDLGSVTTADINGGTIDGVTLSATIANVDNIQIDSNAITSTNGNGNIALTPNGTGSVVISKVDIAVGEIDGTAIGANAASTGAFTDLSASGTVSFAGATVSNLGSVTTADINGGTIDGTDITVGAGKTLNVVNGILSLADDQISGAKIDGGVISNFASTGIDDNAASTTVTVTATNNVGLGVTDPDEKLEVNGDAKVGAAGDSGKLHLGLTSDEASIVGRGALHATLPNTLDVEFGGTPTARFSTTGVNVTGSISVSGLVDSRDVNADGTKLDGIAAGATNTAIPAIENVAGTPTLATGITPLEVRTAIGAGTSSISSVNLGATATATSLSVTSDQGTNASIPAATTSAWGAMTDEDKSKLNGIETGAQVNVGTNLSSTADGTQLQVNSSTGGNVDLPAATTAAWGVMTDEDKSKLDGIASGAQVNVATNLGSSATGASFTVTSSTGTNASLPAVTTSAWGIMTDEDKSKLDGIAAGADVNVGTNISVSEGSTTVAINSSTGSNDSIAAATTSLAGVMTGADKTKLNGIASGAQVNVGTNISISESANTVAINSSTGSDDSIAAATTSLAGVMTATDKTKLNGIASGATNTAVPAITSNGTTPSLASGITGAEVRSLIGAGTSSTTGTVTSVLGGNGLTGSVSTSGSLAVGAGTGISVGTNTVGLATAGAGAGTYGSTANGTKIDQITLDAYGRVTAISTGATGTATVNDTGTPAILSNGSTPSLNSGITGAEVRSLIGAGTATVNDTGVPALLSNGSTPSLNSGITAAEVRSLIGAGTGSGDITGVTAGNGLYGGATSGTATVNLYSQMTVGGTQTISDGELISVNTSGQTITLPSSPAQGDTVYISVGKFTNTTIAKNGSNISGLNENLIIDVADIGITLIYSGNATMGWRLF